MISTLELNSGEFIAMNVIEIVSIPKLSIVKEDFAPDADIENEYKQGFGSLLLELYQNNNYIKRQNSSAEFASELLWLTEYVNNQPYKANIRLFLINRALSSDETSAKNIAERISNACCDTLKLFKYNYKRITYEYLKAKIDKLDNKYIGAIVKDESEELLQNQLLPCCYSFDVFDSYARDMSGVVNCLIQHPNCAVSFQITPTKYNQNELSSITQVSQILDTLSKGINTQGIGAVSYSIADNLTNVYKYYLNNRNSALFNYNILILGDEESIDDISSKIQGYINYNIKKSVSLKNILLKNNDIQYKENFYASPFVSKEFLINSQRNTTLWNESNKYQNMYNLPYIITAEEASGLFRLPVGNHRISAGLNINETESSSKSYGNNLINSGDIEIGKLKSSQDDSIGIVLSDLAKHMLVVGTPGSGKTTFSVSLLDRLWKTHHIPFLVIEPAKNEYRALIQSIPELQVFTPGKNFISPFVFNPFVPPKNVKLETYKSTLKTAFAAAVSMTTPLDKIFEEAINNCYSDFRWLDSYTIDDKGKVFNISDFIKCFQNTFEEIGYTGDAKNIGRAGVVRLNSLVNLFDNYFSIPIEDLISKPTVIELAAVENADQKSLIIALLLLSILAYVNANYVGEGGLKNLIMLEEAHVLLDSDTNHGEGEANPSAIAKGLVKRMLAEIRSYGVSLVIADQSPKKVSTDVVALTDMKVAFRLVENEDKQIISDSTNMSEIQKNRLAKLKPGEAFVFFNKLDEPEEVITPNYRLDNKISISLSDENIKKLSKYWDDKKDKLKPYPQCSLCTNCNECDYKTRILSREIARRIFVRNFKSDDTKFDNVLLVFSKITSLIKAELNDEIFTPQLFSCTKLHLWRKILYNTKIPVTKEQIENSLKK